MGQLANQVRAELEEALDQRRKQVHRVALGHRVEVELDTRIALDEPPLLDAHLIAADEGEDRIDVRMRLGLAPGEAPRLDPRRRSTPRCCRPAGG